MKKMSAWEIGIFFLMIGLFSPAAFIYADTVNSGTGEIAENLAVPTVPATGSSPSQSSALPPPAENSVGDFTDFLSSNITLVNTPVLEPPPVSVGQPSGRAVGLVVDTMINDLVTAGYETAVTQTVTFISNKDYAGLVNFQKNNPEAFNAIITSMKRISATYAANTPTRHYIEDWWREANRVREQLLQTHSGDSPDELVDAVERLYKPIEARISEIARSFEAATSALGDSGNKDAEAFDLLKDFSGKVKEYVLNSVNRAQANLADGMLSNPLEATAFAAETGVMLASSATLDPTGLRAMTLAELYIKSRKYQVVDSVHIGRDFIYAQRMLHPPANLHPYLKWLLYTRNLTPRMVEKYLATREAVGAIYAQAKAGRGNIRYKGKVYGAFLPFAETAAGNYELVKPASDE